MPEQKKSVTRVNLKVPTSLYTEYKIALLRRYHQNNVTQDLIAYMKRVIEETKNLNEERSEI